MSHLDDLLKRSGWSPLDAESMKGLTEERRAAALELASCYRRVFESDDGKRILELMVRATILQPTVHPTATQFEAGIREGRCDLVRGILRQMELARDPSSK